MVTQTSATNGGAREPILVKIHDVIGREEEEDGCRYSTLQQGQSQRQTKVVEIWESVTRENQEDVLWIGEGEDLGRGWPNVAIKESKEDVYRRVAKKSWCPKWLSEFPLRY